MAIKDKSTTNESGTQEQDPQDLAEELSEETSESLTEEPTDEAVEAPVSAESEKTPTVALEEAAAEASTSSPSLSKSDTPANDQKADPGKKADLGKKADGGKKADLGKKGDGSSAAVSEPTAAAQAPEDNYDPEYWDNASNVAAIFNKASDERPLNDIVSAIVLDEPAPRASFVVVLVALVLGIGALVGVYLSLSADEKHCLDLQMDGFDCPAYFQAKYRGVEDEARREAVKNAPQVGTITVVTTPAQLLISGDNIQPFINVGRQTLRAATRIELQGIPADAATSFTIDGGVNFQDKEVQILPAADVFNTLWSQNARTGEYRAEFNFQLCLPGSINFGASNCLYFQERDLAPGIPAYEEYLWRVRWTPPENPEEGQPVRITNAAVTVTSNPPGAEVTFNGRPALGADGQPCRTPCTFSSYAAAPNSEDQTPVAVNVSNEPKPVVLTMDGKMPAAADVVGHNFLCTPIEGMVPTVIPAEGPLARNSYDFMGFCSYTQEIHFDLSDPVVEAEGSAE